MEVQRGPRTEVHGIIPHPTQYFHGGTRAVGGRGAKGWLWGIRAPGRPRLALAPGFAIGVLSRRFLSSNSFHFLGGCFFEYFQHFLNFVDLVVWGRFGAGAQL